MNSVEVIATVSLVVMVELIFSPVIQGNITNFHYRKVHKNREVVFKPLIKTTVKAMVACPKMCSEMKKCVSISFNSISKECKLYNHYITDTTETNEKMGEITLSIKYMNGRRELSKQYVNSSSAEPGYSAVNVLDNDPSSCLVTELTDTDPWLLVDLGHVYTVSDVVVHTSDDVTVQHKFHDVNFELYSVDPTLNPEVKGLCCGSTEGLSASRVVIVRCSCDVAGRFVKIYIEKSEKLTICHVQVLTRTDISGCVYSEASICKKWPRTPNIATKEKYTIQSMVFYGESSRYAIDGNRSTCIRVRASAKSASWWTVDLGRIYNITSITVANVLDDKWKNLQNLTITYSDRSPHHQNAKVFPYTFVEGYFGATTRTFECDNPAVTRHILAKTTGAYLLLCTVEITGSVIN